ncbi:peptidoglycan recognition protein family protein [Selenomonadales bacterium OttesenSCG-928-I06]|nr:peptidoglycan recognition protein family protein [Selenomonadales bacterium OttesenSCG-928-I06]
MRLEKKVILIIKVTLDEIKTMQCVGSRPQAIYLHWTAGGYNTVFSTYQFCIKGNGDVYTKETYIQTGGAHTYGRNSNSIAVSLCCAFGASPDKDGLPTGDCPPTANQIETAAKLIEVLAKKFGLEINYDNIKTHAEAALEDGYGPHSGDPNTRWDLWKLKDYDGIIKDGGEVLRGKAKWYRDVSSF